MRAERPAACRRAKQSEKIASPHQAPLRKLRAYQEGTVPSALKNPMSDQGDTGRLPVLSAHRIASLHRNGARAPGPVRVMFGHGIDAFNTSVVPQDSGPCCCAAVDGESVPGTDLSICSKLCAERIYSITSSAS